MTMGGFVTLVVLAMIGAYVYIFLAAMPVKTARERGHPNADAINVLGWVGLLLGVGPWLIALVWSRMQPMTKVKTPSAGVTTTGREDDPEAA